MVRKTGLLVVLASMIVGPQALADKGDWRFSVAGGISAPMGDFSKKIGAGGLGAKLGFGVSPSVDYLVTESMALGVDASFTRNHLNSDERDLVRAAIPDPSFDLKFTQVGAGAHLKYWFPMADNPVGVYALGGLGFVNFKAEATSDSSVAGEDSSTEFMAHGGLGAGYKASEKATIGLEGEFNYLTLDKSTFLISSATGFGVKAVVTFGVPRSAR
jgi:opacity protein-like surface antigen